MRPLYVIDYVARVHVGTNVIHVLFRKSSQQLSGLLHLSCLGILATRIFCVMNTICLMLWANLIKQY